MCSNVTCPILLHFGSELKTVVTESKLLIVGAGGIGCELLKNLVVCGFGEIHIVDLDTIDITNLNRQFLFQKQHVSQSKAHIAKSAAQKFNPKVNIKSYHANIKDPIFDLQWFLQFSVVFNALDNQEARKHVNFMCVAAHIPLIDGGSAGYLGQSMLILPTVTECYDCTPRDPPMTYPICTIRSRPSKPIHCIVWAKSYLFPLLFQDSDDSSDSSIDTKKVNDETKVLLSNESERIRNLSNTASKDYPFQVFRQLFHHDIAHLVSMTKDTFDPHSTPKLLDIEFKDEWLNSTSYTPSSDFKKDQVILSITELAEIFIRSFHQLSILKQSSSSPLHYDKDQKLHSDFVAAAANLRSFCFQLPMLSFFEIYSMANRIVPIVATTNAMLAAVMVQHWFHYLSTHSYHPSTWSLQLRSDMFLGPSNANPNATCAICSPLYFYGVGDLHSLTLKQVLKTILNKFNLTENDVGIYHGFRLLYDVDEDLHLPKTLTELKLASKDWLFFNVDPELNETDNEEEETKMELLNNQNQFYTPPTSFYIYLMHQTNPPSPFILSSFKGKSSFLSLVPSKPSKRRSTVEHEEEAVSTKSSKSVELSKHGNQTTFTTSPSKKKKV